MNIIFANFLINYGATCLKVAMNLEALYLSCNNNSKVNRCNNISPVFVEKFYGNEIMDKRNQLVLTWMHSSTNNASMEYKKEELSDNHSTDGNLCVNMFSWLNKFNKLMCSSVGHRSYQLLTHLLSLYTQ